jgi:hypothetical protein
LRHSFNSSEIQVFYLFGSNIHLSLELKAITQCDEIK